jgi:predicted permease
MPSLSRDGRDREIATTVRDACLNARRERGTLAAIATGVVECVSVMRAVVRMRVFHSSSPITIGQAHLRRPERSSHMLRRAHTDLKMAYRSLTATKLTSAIALLTLAVGIGINTTVFTILDSTLFRPVPFRDADRLANLASFDATQGFSYFGFPAELLKRWQEQKDLFDRVDAFDRGSFVYAAPSGSELIDGATITPGLFGTLGVGAMRGRGFVDGDGRGGTDRIVVISDHFWREQLGRRADVVGSTILLNGETCVVIGVMPADFHYPTSRTDLWMPFDAIAPPASPVVMPQALEPIVRLKAGVSFDQANAETQARGNRLGRAAGIDSTATAKLFPAAKGWDVKTTQSLTMLGAAVGFVMLIVCANLANLSLARSLARARDYAVRSALGASRADIVRETVVENLIIGTLGIALGVVTAWVLQQVTVAMLPEAFTINSVNAIDLDARALAFTAVSGMVATLLFGLPPAVMASRTNVSQGLRLETRASTGSRGARRWRSGLVVVEVSLSVVLLVGAALMARSLVKLQSEDRGFDSRGVLSMTIGLPAPAYADATARRDFGIKLSSTLTSMHGVSGVTLGGVPATMAAINAGTLEFSSNPGATTESIIIPAHEIPQGYFEMLHMPMREGHGFRDGDPDDAVVVSAAFAKKYWPGRSAIGERFRFASGPMGGPLPWRTVTGVVGNVRPLNDGRDNGFLLYYLEGHAGHLFTTMRASSAIGGFETFVVRADDPAAFASTLRSAVHDADPAAVIWKTELVDRLYADAFSRPRVVFFMMATFAIFGLVLVAAGLYGALSHLVAHRLREIGIRSALGATRTQIARLVIGQSLVLTLTGLVAGLLMALPLIRTMRSILYDVEASDPASVIAVSLLLVLVALAATWRPARSAARVDPASLLRG